MQFHCFFFHLLNFFEMQHIFIFSFVVDILYWFLWLQGPPNKSSGLCATCHAKYEDCPGHYGCLTLALPVFNIGYIGAILDVLKCICKVCAVFICMIILSKLMTNYLFMALLMAWCFMLYYEYFICIEWIMMRKLVDLALWKIIPILLPTWCVFPHYKIRLIHLDVFRFFFLPLLGRIVHTFSL